MFCFHTSFALFSCDCLWETGWNNTIMHFPMLCEIGRIYENWLISWTYEFFTSVLLQKSNWWGKQTSWQIGEGCHGKRDWRALPQIDHIHFPGWLVDQERKLALTLYRPRADRPSLSVRKLFELSFSCHRGEARRRMVVGWLVLIA